MAGLPLATGPGPGGRRTRIIILAAGKSSVGRQVTGWAPNRPPARADGDAGKSYMLLHAITFITCDYILLHTLHAFTCVYMHYMLLHVMTCVTCHYMVITCSMPFRSICRSKRPRASLATGSSVSPPRPVRASAVPKESRGPRIRQGELWNLVGGSTAAGQPIGSCRGA